MVLIDLINILKNDTTLATLLGASVSNSKIMPMPLITQGIGYNFVTLTYDGVKAQSQFELTIINLDVLKCYEIKNRIDDLLVTVGDSTLTTDILSCYQNGGGQYFDDDLNAFRLKVNYTIISREVKK